MVERRQTYLCVNIITFFFAIVQFGLFKVRGNSEFEGHRKFFANIFFGIVQFGLFKVRGNFEFEGHRKFFAIKKTYILI